MRAIKQVDGVWHCFICGAVAPNQAAPHVGKCKCEQPASRPGLGDMVAAGLSAVGITPERVSAVTGKPCGCKKRQEALNALGRRLGIG